MLSKECERMMYVSIEDGSKIELPEGSTAMDLAILLKKTAPSESVSVCINGTTLDLSTKLKDGDQAIFWNFSQTEGKEVFWHTSAHVLAQAVLRLWPDAQPTIGPPIENGFYYDFANLHISDEDFPAIEKEMKKIISENHKTEREEFANIDEALEKFASNKYKCELIKSFEKGSPLTAYRQGEFYDLCRGPHMYSLGKIKALKIMKTSGAYWRGDSKNEMLTRIYGITFPDRKELQSYLKLLEEAKKRDHKIIGPRLDLFSFSEHAPGMPIIHHKGMIIWNQLIDFWRKLHKEADYQEIKTPTMMSKSLWEISGHWEHYRENMFTSEIEKHEYAIKPMNCPGGCLLFHSKTHSYRDLPERVAEIGHVHRYEPSGAISGLFRVRSFHQDDAHIYMEAHHIEDEILKVLELTDKIYTTFGLEYHLELSTRPEEGTIGSDEDWELSTKALQMALEKSGREYVINEGDGAFYGPKIDMHIRDAIGRTWQCGTIQLDMSLPVKFDLEYTASDGSRKRPIMIHRALFGSIERFFGILIEHFAGRFPLWLSPRQVRLLIVADRHADYAREIHKKLKKLGFESEMDDSNESISKKVRNAQLDQVNYILTIGDKEVEHKTINVRTRDNVVHGEVDLLSFIEKIEDECKSRARNSPYSK
jgi:threonyl-tRNA synthetase